MAEKYTVTGVDKRFKLTATGDIVETYVVSFQTVSGLRSSVDIPAHQFTPDFVKRVLDAEAEKLERVRNL